MCGIFGHINFSTAIDRESLIRQRDQMVHRGPDSAGAWVSDDSRVGFGHRRLAIVDLSPAGHQPMVDETNGNCLCFNGEIYNFQSVRSTLEGLGFQFRSHSDTEVILAAYAQWGVECVDRLDGMFAFALYDKRSRRVLLARDRAGEKPLYLWKRDGGISFASELKALLADPALPRRASRASLNEYLTYGFVTGTNTMLDAVSRLPAGHLAVVDLDHGTITEDAYWRLPVPPRDQPTASEAELASELEARLSAAIERQLVADVPVGVLLSGGLDSSVIAAIASTVSGQRIRTFTARFAAQPASDEGPYARLVSDYIGSEHTELDTQPASESLLRELAAQFDDPIADSSLIPTFLLSREIRKHATVALGGDGGDELFGGYRHYPVQLRQASMRDRLPAGAGRAIAHLSRAALPDAMPGIGRLTSLGDSDGEIVAGGSRLFRPSARRQLLNIEDETVLLEPERRKANTSADRTGMLAVSTATDFRSYMVDDVLVKVDRASMLASLEVRAPFLSRDVVEFAFGRLTDRQKCVADDRKILLRSLGSKLLPPQLDLKRKQGFDIPLDAWIAKDWAQLLRELASRRSALLAVNPLDRLLARVGSRPIVGEQVFAIAMLLLWEERYGISL